MQKMLISFMVPVLVYFIVGMYIFNLAESTIQVDQNEQAQQYNAILDY